MNAKQTPMERYKQIAEEIRILDSWYRNGLLAGNEYSHNRKVLERELSKASRAL